MGATMFGSSVFADDAQRLTNVEVLATQNKTNIDILKNDVQALKGASTKDTYSKDEVDSKLADKANQSDVTTNTNGIATNKQAISDEATARQNADADLQKGVDANKQAISDEATARQNADADLQKGVDANKQAISDEATARQNADADLQKGVDANKQAIADETTARQTDVANLQTNIKDALTNQGVVNDTLTKAVQANSNAIVTSSQNLEKHLGETDGRVDKANAEIHTNAGNIAQNKADIAQNKTDIAANKKAISDAVAEQGKINNAQNEINGKLTTAVQNNSQAIVANAEAAKNLEKHLGETDGRVDKANAEIHTNVGNIAQNKADIAQNKTDIAANKKAISDAVAEQGKINNAQNEINGKLTTAVQNNSQAIGTTKNGNYVKSSNSVGANLNALDAQVGQNSSNINQLFSDYSSMKTDINKVGARSAALAGLHAVDYDPSNKLSFAVASGSFRSENSVALGAFYRPNENIMFSAASTMGDSDNAYTFGLSFKIGPSSAKTKTTSPDAEELYKVVGQLQDQLAAQQKEIEQLKANKAK